MASPLARGARSDLKLELESVARAGVDWEVDLSTFTRWAVGGRAVAVAHVTDEFSIAAVVSIARRWQLPFLVVGETSNLLFDTRGFNGVLIQIADGLADVEVSGLTVRAGAGVSAPSLARIVGAAGLTGLEHIVGIPGTLGGLVTMNGGSLRQSIGSSVVSVRGVAPGGEVVTLSHDDCDFSHRHSELPNLLVAITQVTLRLQRADRSQVSATMDAITSDRASKFPLDQPSCGSTFVSHPAMYATVGAPGRAIEETGLKGLRRGNAMISEKHANFFVNLGGASSDDMLWLIAVARNMVRERTGFLMDCEARYVSPDGVVEPAHLAAERRWGDSTTASRGVA